MLAKATQGTWTAEGGPFQLNGQDDGPNFSGGDWEIYPTADFEGGPVCIASTQERRDLIATRVNATKADLNMAEGLCAILENLSVGHVAHAIADNLLTNWLRERGVEVKP